MDMITLDQTICMNSDKSMPDRLRKGIGHNLYGKIDNTAALHLNTYRNLTGHGFLVDSDWKITGVVADFLDYENIMIESITDAFGEYIKNHTSHICPIAFRIINLPSTRRDVTIHVELGFTSIVCKPSVEVSPYVTFFKKLSDYLTSRYLEWLVYESVSTTGSFSSTAISHHDVDLAERLTRHYQGLINPDEPKDMELRNRIIHECRMGKNYLLNPVG